MFWNTISIQQDNSTCFCSISLTNSAFSSYHAERKQMGDFLVQEPQSEELFNLGFYKFTSENNSTACCNTNQMNSTCLCLTRCAPTTLQVVLTTGVTIISQLGIVSPLVWNNSTYFCSISLGNSAFSSSKVVMISGNKGATCS
jgi:hypothetical protein